MGKTDLNERIKAFATYKGLSIRAFELASGMSNGYVKNISSAIGGDKLLNIGKAFPDLNLDWLVFGNGNMILEDTPNDGVLAYDTDFSCGNAVMYNDSAASVVGSLSMAEYANATAIVRATGNSMHPLISSGDKVIIKEVENWPENIIYGQIYGVETDGDIRTIKRVRRSTEEGVVILEPINKDEYDNTPIQAAQITKMWLVLGCIKQFV